ncbi:hypothetical protein ACH35V_05335 [Actinomadura sp. 1N219]|uniref:hypothetical protein n=1 Tax=Actinomadura sp. 1N219 TaxID=3375152 RepID=UPI003793AFB8
MIKRVPLAGLVLAATVLPLAAPAAAAGPATAQAARGVLWVNDQRYVDPAGCYNATQFPLTASNATDTEALIYDELHCEGLVIGKLPPDGQRHVVEFGKSIRIY